VPPDSVPRPRFDAASSTRKAVRGGVLAALSDPQSAPAREAPPAAAPDTAAAPAVAQQHHPPPPARGFVVSLRAAGRRGLLAAKPLALPFLHRLQMRMRTAVDESGLSARTAGVEQALARLSERFDAEFADVKRLVADGADRLDALNAAAAAAASDSAFRQDAALRRLDEARQGLDAVRREVAGLGEAAAGHARRLDAIGAAADVAASDGALRQEAALRRLEETGQRMDAARRELGTVQQGVNAIRQGVAAVSDAVRPRPERRPPIPVGGDFLIHTPDGYLLVPGEDVPFLVFIAESGVPEPGTRRVLEALLRPGGAFLDVGANVGTLTLFAARAVGREGRVFAIEPTPRLAALLGRSLAMNGVSERVSIAACAAGEASGEAALHLDEIMSHNSLFPSSDAGAAGAGRTVAVPVRTVDEVVPPGTALDAAKIDVEGAELLVWRGMRRVLAESPRLAAVLEFGPAHLGRAGVSPEAWLEEVAAPGFSAFMIDEATGVCRPASASALVQAESTNVLLLRPGAAERHPGLVFA
jgi:FkbM family methyltransferase